MRWQIGARVMRRHAIAFCYGFAENKWRACNLRYSSGNMTQPRLKNLCDWDHSTFFDDITIGDGADIFDGNRISIAERDLLQGALVWSTSAHGLCFFWTEKTFGFSEHQPNAAEIHLDPRKRRDYYLTHMHDTDIAPGKLEKPLIESQFSTMP